MADAAEMAAWSQLMRAHHYLKSSVLVGESLRYIAEHEGQWLALIGWSTAALKCGPRDRWIGWNGWNEFNRWRRLQFVANNSRFLILPGPRIPNLASRALSLNVRGLAADWQAVHGHPVWLAETFVDSRRFHGGCYRAAGWIPVGQTRGFGRRAGRYVKHGQLKTVFVRPLFRRARAWLTRRRPYPQWETDMQFDVVTREQAEDLVNRLRALEDPRRPRGIRHVAASVLAISICAALSGARGYTAIWEWASRCSQDMLTMFGCRRKPGGLERVAPSEPTIRRILQSIDAGELDRTLGDWMASAETAQDGIVAMDGKTLKGALLENGRQTQLLSALHLPAGTVANQVEVESKTNEIPMASALLEPLALEGKTVTADALHTQRETARFIVEQKRADYLFTVKDNQPGLRRDIADLFEPKIAVDFPPSARNGGQGARTPGDPPNLEQRGTQWLR